MSCTSRCILLSLVLAVAGSAWADSGIPGPAVKERGKLHGDRKIRYLLRQLELSEEQATYAEGLLESMVSQERLEAEASALEEVRKLYNQIERAKATGDQERVESLTQELKQLGQRVSLDDEFFVNMTPQLSERQQRVLKKARSRLERNPSGSVRPLDILRAAQKLDLAAGQRAKLLDAHAAARQRLGPVLRPSQKLRLELVNLVYDKVRETLTPEQLAEFEFRVRALRPDLIDEGLRVAGPAALEQESLSSDEKGRESEK